MITKRVAPISILFALVASGMWAGSRIVLSHAAATTGSPHALLQAPRATVLPIQPSPSETIYAYPPGVPAIVPITSTADIAVAGFGAADVEQYLGRHPLFTTVGSGGGTIGKILFITAAAASTLLRGESIGRPDNALVCYVEIQGPLSTADITFPSGSEPKGTPVPAQTGVLVFDAQTGNLLLQGFTA